ncbi:hypothetical protein B9Q11_04210 [Candidatus Marsarchaeota G2 archaeon ECH_B_SAG-F08]|jgi:leucyl aminopeptidase (aminopeptidase T)|uniref:Leucyl aminopeptidase n=1 Tax=Candidatus Marsarchaeota G2 archaeon ECH_B_SAG-F08 TaxID=1978165 RepID=A0A2R6BFK9_9ARCH|nr:MAG: hypothetical protein B9Q11_04210 [Candidatus Marsarchaeota G2 archaeon ECH_B_SAG-F08]
MDIARTALEGAKVIITYCLGVEKEEKSLIVYDEPNQEKARIIKKAFELLGYPSPTLSPYNRLQTIEHDVVIFCVSERLTLALGHSDLKHEVCSRGGRVGFVTQPLENTPSVQEIERIAKRTKFLAEKLEKAEGLTISTRGHSLRLYTKGRKPIAITSLIRNAGEWGALPDYAEVAIAPVEHESFGEFYVDCLIVGLGKPENGLLITFENGRVASLKNGEIGRALERLISSDDDAHELAEVGFGTNHLRRTPKGEFDDKKILGSVHIALGDNHTIGGILRSKVHVDCLSINSEVWVSGKRVFF